MTVDNQFILRKLQSLENATIVFSTVTKHPFLVCDEETFDDELLLFGVWGTGPKEYSAMKLTLMLMGGSALLILGILGIYFFNGKYGGTFTFELNEIAKTSTLIPLAIQKVLFPFIFIGFGVLGALFPFHTWSPDGHASAPTAVSMLHAAFV